MTSDFAATPDFVETAAALIATARAMNSGGFNSGTSGNVSCRFRDGFLVTPSSVAYEELEPGDIVQMQFDGSWAVENAARRPSSEWHFHCDVLAARPEVHAVVHAHPINATAIAVHGQGIGPFHYMVGIFGGHDVRCAPYSTFGTPELSEAVVTALQDRWACLIEHHGVVACGATLQQALDRGIELEVLAAQYLAARRLGEPPLLSAEQMDAVLAKMSEGPGYGSSASTSEDT